MARKFRRFKKRPIVSSKMSRAIKSVVKSTISSEAETKQHTDGFTYTSVWGATAGVVLEHLLDIAQNTTDTGRIGDEIYLKHIKVRGIIQNNVGAASNAFNDIRVMVFQYKSQDNAPSADELLLNNAISGATRAAYSARNQDYMNIYNVLYDKTYHVEQGTPNAANYASSGSYSKHVEFSVPLKRCKRKIQYEAAATSNTVNGLYLFVIGSSASVASNPTCAFQWAVSYLDS